MGDKPFTPRTSLLPPGEGSGDEGTERKAFMQSSVTIDLCFRPETRKQKSER